MYCLEYDFSLILSVNFVGIFFVLVAKILIIDNEWQLAKTDFRNALFIIILMDKFSHSISILRN